MVIDILFCDHRTSSEIVYEPQRAVSLAPSPSYSSINHLRSYLLAKIPLPTIFFIPYSQTTYKFQPPQISSIFAPFAHVHPI